MLRTRTSSYSAYDMLIQNHRRSLEPVRQFRPVIHKEEPKYEVETNRMTDIKEIKKEKKKVKEAIIEKNIRRKEVMEDVEDIEEIKDERIILNNTLKSMIDGFFSTKNKNKYIELNADNFKSLQPNEQRTIFQIFLTYVN